MRTCFILTRLGPFIPCWMSPCRALSLLHVLVDQIRSEHAEIGLILFLLEWRRLDLLVPTRDGEGDAARWCNERVVIFEMRSSLEIR